MDKKNLIIGVLLGVLLIKLLKKKKCGCVDESEIPSGGGANNGATIGSEYKIASKGGSDSVIESVIGKITPVKKEMIKGYPKEEVCECKKAVESVMAEMKFASQQEANLFAESEIEKCLNTK